jgi:hypothetical protein
MNEQGLKRVLQKSLQNQGSLLVVSRNVYEYAKGAVCVCHLNESLRTYRLIAIYHINLFRINYKEIINNLVYNISGKTDPGVVV